MAELLPIRVRINDTPYERSVEARKLLVDFIRDDIGLTGTHIGCEHGVCGACTVLLNGEPSQSCLLFAVQVDGSEIVTVEGLGSDARCIRCRKHFLSLMDCSADFARRAC